MNYYKILPFYLLHSSDSIAREIQTTPTEIESDSQLRIEQRLLQPYLGVHSKKQWHHEGLMGRIMSPIEDIYFSFLPDHQMVQRINEFFPQQPRPLIT